MVLKICVVCGDEFDAKTHRNKLCGEPCRVKRNRDSTRRYREKTRSEKTEKNCVICDRLFIPVKKTTKTCSSDCRIIYRRNDSRERMRKKREDPEFVRIYNEKYRESFRLRQRERRKDPEYRERERIRSQEYYNRAEVKKRRAAYAHDRWFNDPEYRNKSQNRKKTKRYKTQAYQRYKNRVLNEPGFREKELERCRQYRATKTGIRTMWRINAANRNARKRLLPDTFTTEHCEYALNYFNGCCAVCESQLNGMFDNTKLHLDHWIPLAYEGEDNPGTVATNMLPLCASCNLSKNNTMPDVWLRRQYSERKARQIEQRIQDYFDHVKEQS